MAFDISRFTFDSWKDFSGVVMEQGRVQLDSDWNEWQSEIARRIQAGTLDIFGHAAYPATTPAAFYLAGAAGPAILIGCGRMYVDGLLAENHGQHKNAQWDTALAELSGAPQPPPGSLPTLTESNAVDFLHQPYYPGAALPTAAGSYLFYLDVWKRPVTYLEDSDLIDKAVGVDTTGRLQTAWQVKWMAFPSGKTYACATPDSEIAYPPASAGRLTTDVVPNPTAGPCCLTTGTGYTGMENQCYRVEIHQRGTGGDPASTNDATFKWSRDNASVATRVTAITKGSDTAHKTVSVLTVTSLGRDQVLGFNNGDWIEILDNWTEFSDVSGLLYQIDSVDVSARTITLTDTVPTTSPAAGNFPVDKDGLTYPHRCTRIIRWDQSGTVYKLNGTKLDTWCDLATTKGEIPVPAPGTTLVLESGITVEFSLDSSMSAPAFDVGDFWIFDARTADGSVEKLHSAPPIGIHHHYTKLATVSYDPTAGSTPAATDCRTPWGPAGQGSCGCCVTVGEGGHFSKIQQAIDSLVRGKNGGGEVCILPGRYYEYVVIKGLMNVVIRGCGAQTRLASPTMQEGGPTKVPAGATESGLAAIITVTGSAHVELRSFAVEAAADEVGILLDPPPANTNVDPKIPDIADVTIQDVVITASTRPAIAAVDVDLLKIADNRIAMKDTAASVWASIYARGTEMHIERNWIGLQSAASAVDWIPATVVGDLGTTAFGALAARPRANGGIQIGGSSRDVFISENEIEGGWRNGVTLGSFAFYVDKKDTRLLTGVLPEIASGNATLQLAATAAIGGKTGDLVADAGLKNIEIVHNRIRNMGLCGVGPVGFFNLKAAQEVISIENLVIADNAISGTLQDTIAEFEQNASLFGYGAVCVPDVQNLIIRDNVVTDFGNTAGAQVCGIYVLMGELVEVSGNQVLETRDWTAVPSETTYVAEAVQAGILVAVTPPALIQKGAGNAWASSVTGSDKRLTPLYQPGLPALRLENNVVRVPLGVALDASGYGPFSILGNHFSSGGTLPARPDPSVSPLLPLTVRITNLGLAIELDPASSFLNLFQTPPRLKAADNFLANSSSGAVLFANNTCQLEARASGAAGIASVGIFTLDHLVFSNNHCWLDGAGVFTVLVDALLFASSLQVCGNRFQESFFSVYWSGFTFGVSNITALNMATYCLEALPQNSGINNVVFESTWCPRQ